MFVGITKLPNITNNYLLSDVFSIFENPSDHTIGNYESSFAVTSSTSTVVARMRFKARRAPIGIGIFSDPVISTSSCSL